jgi:hypothetical protein
LAEVRERIRALAAGPPGPAQPRHRFDHPADQGDDDADVGSVVDADRPGRPRLRAGGHPPGTPGPYRLPRRLRRLVQARSPLCEWPGCGVRAQMCDIDHDNPWPAGATCACNTGPLCRRHHRVKQLLMTKTRTARGVRWTGPTGRSWLSPVQHQAPADAAAAAVRPPAPASVAEHHLSPAALAELLAEPDTDPAQYDLRAVEDEPDDTDRVGDALRDDDGWGLVLDDPYRWVT